MKHKWIPILALLLLCATTMVTAQTAAGAPYGGPGLYSMTLFAGQTLDAGTVAVWNSTKKLMVQVEPTDGWKIAEVQIYVGYPDVDPIPAKKGNPVLGKFPYKQAYENPALLHTLTLDLKDDLGFSWGSQYYDRRAPALAVHVDLVKLDDAGVVIREEGAWAFGPYEFEGSQWGWWTTYGLAHPQRGHFIDAPVVGIGYRGPTQQGVTADSSSEEGGGFLFFPDETIEFSVGSVTLGSALAAKKVSPLDLFHGADVNDSRAINVARLLQSLDDDHSDGKINIRPIVVDCLDTAMANLGSSDGVIDWTNDVQVEAVIVETIAICDGNVQDIHLQAVSAEEAQGNLEAGLNASGIFRKNVSKTEEWGESKQKLEVMPVYFPGLRSNGDPSLCYDEDGDKLYDEGIDTLGVPYEEWRLNGDPAAEECDPRLFEDPQACQLTLIDCREIAKPLLVTYLGKVDIYDDQVKEDFWPDRFSWDVYTAISRAKRLCILVGERSALSAAIRRTCHEKRMSRLAELLVEGVADA